MYAITFLQSRTQFIFSGAFGNRGVLFFREQVDEAAVCHDKPPLHSKQCLTVLLLN